MTGDAATKNSTLAFALGVLALSSGICLAEEATGRKIKRSLTLVLVFAVLVAFAGLSAVQGAQKKDQQKSRAFTATRVVMQQGEVVM